MLLRLEVVLIHTSDQCFESSSCYDAGAHVAFNLFTDKFPSFSVHAELENEAYRETGQRTRPVIVRQRHWAAQQLRLRKVQLISFISEHTRAVPTSPESNRGDKKVAGLQRDNWSRRTAGDQNEQYRDYLGI